MKKVFKIIAILLFPVLWVGMKHFYGLNGMEDDNSWFIGFATAIFMYYVSLFVLEFP
jgi:hypothetical protein